MSISVAIKKVQRNLNDYGIGETLRKALSTLAGSVYLERIYRVYRRNLRTAQPAAEAPPGIEVRVIGADDAQAIRDIETMEEWLQGGVRDRLSRGLCVAAFDGSRVVGFNIVAFREIFVPLISNIASLKSAQKVGFQFLADVRYRKVLGREERTYRRIDHGGH
jgi:hypothetical protein